MKNNSALQIARVASAATVAILMSTVSHQALAACGPGPAGTAILCQDPGSVNNTDINLSVSANQNGILVEDADGDASLENNGDITINQSGFAAQTIGINVDDNAIEGSYQVVNNGEIDLFSVSRAQLYGIAGNGDVEELELENNADITIERSGVTLTTLTNAALQGNAGGNVGNLAVGAGVFAEEELESLSVENTATITAKGLLTSGVYSRAGEFTLDNSGTIQNSAGAGNGMAIAAVSDSGILTEVEITNSGTIVGDVVIVNGHAQRWYGITKGLNTAGTFDSRLAINSQFGDINSEFVNEEDAVVKGDFHYGNGAHTLVNEDGAEIEGDIFVEQRPFSLTGRTCPTGAAGCFTGTAVAGDTLEGLAGAEEASPYAVSQFTGFSGANSQFNYTSFGAKEFTFENAGTYKGDLTVSTANATTIFGTAVPDSVVTLSPHIFGGGQDDQDDAVNPDAQAYIDGTLKVADGMVNGAGGTSSIARTTTIAPVLRGLVKDGEWYTVATKLIGADVPEVTDSALIDWEAVKNGSDALVIGADVATADDIGGLSSPAASTLDGLLGSDSDDEDFQELAAALQSLEDEEDVRTAAEQLAPDTSFGKQQTAFTLLSILGSVIDNRLSATGIGAPGGSGFAPPSGLGMGNNQPQPSYLGAVTGRTVPSARSGGGVWGQGFGSVIDQDARGTTGAYDADIAGLAFGIDDNFGGIRLGAAFSYANSEINEGGVRSGNRTSADSYTGLLYTAFGGSGWYAAAQTGYTLHQYDSSRRITVPLSTDANANFDGNQFHIGGEWGAPMRFGSSLLVPVASLDFNWLQQDAYNESGPAGLAVSEQTTESLVSGLGVKFQTALGTGLTAGARAIWLHEFLDTEQSVSARFAAADLQFLASGPATSRDTANLGASLVFGGTSGFTASVDYDAFIREDFVGHAGMGRFRFEY